MKNNWHTHTSRCGHATGTDEEYIISAIKNGYTTIGFSDHAPFGHHIMNAFCPGQQVRMDESQFEEYRDSILSLKEKYKNKINVYCGLEVEYYPHYIKTIEQYSKKLDFMLLGQHSLFLDEWRTCDFKNFSQIERYVNRLKTACSTGLFSYICHPDLCMCAYDGSSTEIQKTAAQIAEISNQYHIPVELNLGGIRKGRSSFLADHRYGYPTKIFFEQFAKYNCKIVIGVDAHSPTDFSRAEADTLEALKITGLSAEQIVQFDVLGSRVIQKP